MVCILAMCVCCRPSSDSARALQEFLTKFKTLKNCVLACNQEGMYKALEAQQGELEICEKALAEFKESKRRAFPRFYFVSSNDLLDILSNGARPLQMGSACLTSQRSQAQTAYHQLATFLYPQGTRSSFFA